MSGKSIARSVAAWREKHRDPHVQFWPNLADTDAVRERTRGHLLAGIGVSAAMMVFAFALGRRVPLLGWADLGFHELGHMLAIPFGTAIHFVAGSATQVAVPVGLAVYFWVTQRDPLGTGFTLVWAGTAAQDTSVYIADAPYQRLQLIGGQHDWAFLFNRWDLMGQAEGIASMVWLVGLLMAFFGAALLVAPLVGSWRAARRGDELAARFADAPVREVRNPPPAQAA